MKQRIQAAAIDRFYDQGLARTTIDDIVAAAGVSKGAFYHHFRSKEEVLAQIRADMLSRQLERFEEVVDSHDTATARLRALVGTIVRAVVEERATVTVWSREHSHLEPEFRAAVLAVRDQLDAIIVTTINEGMASGEFTSSGSAREIAFAIVGMCTWVQEWFSVKDDLSVDELADLYATLVLDGLVTPAAR
jgi:AcrR family transcriptional regulator